VTYFLLKPCRTSAGFTSTLRKKTKLDLKEAGKKLESVGYKITDVEVMLILEGPANLTLYESGKLLLKTNEKSEAQGVADAIYGLLGLAGEKDAATA